MTTNDFDRSLNIRRSKRFVRQSAQTVSTQQQQQQQSQALTAQEISLSPSASSQHVAAVTTTISNNLHKAISTPSIIDKLKSTTGTTTTPELTEDQSVSNVEEKISGGQTTDSNKKNGKFFVFFCVIADLSKFGIQLDPVFILFKKKKSIKQ